MLNKLGFTLIELMIVIAIIGVLALISYPPYLEYVQKARRIDAMNNLFSYQLEQEKYRSHHVQYASDFKDLIDNDSSSVVSSAGYYEITIGETSATTYRMFATPRENQRSDLNCGVFALNQNGPDFSGDYANARCWNQ